MVEGLMFTEVFSALRKRTKQIVTALIFFLVCGGIIGYFIPPVYEAELDVLINVSSSGRTSQVPTMGEIDTNLRLVETYKQIMKSDRVSNLVNLSLQGRYPKAEIKKNIKIESGNASQIITIIAKDDSAENVALLANTYAEIFKEEIRNLMNLDNVTLMAKVEAGVDTTIIKPPLFYYLLISICMGFLMILAGILIQEIHFGVIDTEEKINESLKLPLLGKIKKMRQYTLEEGGRDKMFARSQESDFEMAGANVIHHMKREHMKILLVTSSIKGEGKSFIASHLAAVISNAGNNVTFLDVDFHKPNGRKPFGISDRIGATSVINGFYTLSEVLKKTELPKLNYVGTGPIPPESSIMLQPKEWKELMANIQKENDFIIVDAPDVSVSDVHYILPYVDSVLFVIGKGQLSKKVSLESVQSLRKLDGKILGAVVNG